MVRWYPDPTGRFPERPHFEPAELDLECEKLVEEFLQGYRDKRGQVSYPITTNELCILLERETADLDMYADLSHRGEGVQGETIFAPKGKPTVRIAEELQQPHRENRLRTTLTHELGHVKFHNYLYGLYASAPAPCCLESTMIGAPVYDWMEWQAGYCSGSFLMPSRALLKAVRLAKRELGIAGVPEMASDGGQGLVDRVKSAFQVSSDAATVRLIQRGYLFE